MHSAKLRKLGGSTVVAIPPALLKVTGLSPTDEVTINVKDSKLIIERKGRTHYTLAELMSQCDLTKRLSKEEREWLDAPRVGREEI